MKDLTPIVDAIASQTCILYCGPSDDGGFRLTAEPRPADDKTADSCAQRVLVALGELPAYPKQLLEACSLKAFDFGFDGGQENPPLSVDLSATTIAQMEQLGVSLRITIYPHSDEPAVTEN